MQVDEPRPDGAERGTGGQALQHPGHEQHVDSTGEREQQHHDRLGAERADQHRAAPDVVRQRARHEQRGEDGDGVHAEDHRDRDGREAPARLVGRVQRRRRAGAGEQRHEDRGQEPERNARRERATGRWGELRAVRDGRDWSDEVISMLSCPSLPSVQDGLFAHAVDHIRQTGLFCKRCRPGSTHRLPDRPLGRFTPATSGIPMETCEASFRISKASRNEASDDARADRPPELLCTGSDSRPPSLRVAQARVVTRTTSCQAEH